MEKASDQYISQMLAALVLKQAYTIVLVLTTHRVITLWMSESTVMVFLQNARMLVFPVAAQVDVV